MSSDSHTLIKPSKYLQKIGFNTNSEFCSLSLFAFSLLFRMSFEVNTAFYKDTGSPFPKELPKSIMAEHIKPWYNLVDISFSHPFRHWSELYYLIQTLLWACIPLTSVSVWSNKRYTIGAHGIIILFYFIKWNHAQSVWIRIRIVLQPVQIDKFDGSILVLGKERDWIILGI